MTIDDDFNGPADDFDEPTEPEYAGPAGSEQTAGGPPDKPIEPYRVKHRWPRGQWGGPNIFLRSALFSSSKSALGDYSPGYVASLSHTYIKAQGPRLNQWDLDVFLNVLDACHEGKVVDMTPRELLRRMQRGESSRDVDMLKASCKRLHECHIEASIKYQTMTERRRWSGELFETFECIRIPTSTGTTRERIRISLDPKLSWLIRDDYTYLDIADRKLLRRHRLAAGVHAMYSTHVTPPPYPLDRLRDLLGVAARSGEFERLLQAALEFLREHKLVEGWAIADGKLTVTPTLNEAKIAFLKRKGLAAPVVAAPGTAAGRFRVRLVRWLSRLTARARRMAPW